MGSEVEAKVWDEDLFSLGSSTLDDLLKMIAIYDFGILVLTDDDWVTSRKTSGGAPRDNVLHELGLFAPLSRKGRPYPLHVMVGLEEGRLQIFDYPTTLRASHAAIELALSTGSLGKTKDHEILEKRRFITLQKRSASCGTIHKRRPSPKTSGLVTTSWLGKGSYLCAGISEI